MSGNEGMTLGELGAELMRLWNAQAKYNEAIKAVQTEHADWPEVYALGLVGEVDEVLRASRWKRQQPGRRQRVDREALAEELADVTKYAICLWQEFGFILPDMLAAVGRKTQRLEMRLVNDWFPPEGTNVIVTDLDGTVADFRAGFAESVAIHDHVKTLAMDLDNGLGWDSYERTKANWEEGGGYADLPAYADAVDLLRGERTAGTWLMVVTARPGETIRRVWNDTEGWLWGQGIEPHALLMGRDERLVQLLRLAERRNKVLLLEDDPILAMRAAGAGFKVWLRDQPYNAAIEHANISRFTTFPVVVPWEAV